MTKTVVVTGGCGYIGSHVARAFKQDGFVVHVIDNVYREHTVQGLDGHLINDFASKAALSLILMLKPDVIVHCAGTSLVGPSMTDPAPYYDNNVTKVIKLMDVIKDMDMPPVIMFSSSASVYGSPKQHGLAIEEHSEIRPISPYGSTKAIDEMIFKDYSNAYGINSICFRYFNAAGAMPGTYDLGQEPGATHIIARILEASINKTDFTLYGTNYDTRDGSCVRDYVHVWDIALAHVRAANMLGRTHGDNVTAGHYAINLGTNTGISNWEIIKYVTQKYGLDTLLTEDRRPGDPDILIADSNKATEWLGWTPVNSSLADIVDSAYKWYTRNVRKTV
jgi:UDP-glucose 4-epimerase